ncbi:ABC transporter permease [Ancylomarina longa]|uniref:FtsX-like permease family protein n=1 Tax=Ancylomarina longa TaxID=2487017 RepID=A0A434AGN1_9BACT|nr:ABC transporter permease [Ancylomarina longa]RUT73487.1 FtsX-like permease family protein [Ancylomarina longa]
MNNLLFKLAFRNIFKNRLNSIINIIGLSIGIAASLFVFLFIKYETSFDNFHHNGERIYRLVSTFNSKDNISTSGFVCFPAAPSIKNEIPGIDDFCRITAEGAIKCYKGKELYAIKQFRFADDNFFQFFNFKLLSGNPKTVLNSADKIVLTDQKAKQIFGDRNPIGQSLMYKQKLFTVSGIAANPPANTQLAFDALVSIKYIEQSDKYWKGWGGGITFLSYLLLQKGISPVQIEKSLPNLLYTKVNQTWKESGFRLSESLQNIKDVHLSDGSINYDCPSNRSKNSIFVIACISLLILILGIINYIILYTVQKLAKLKEIGILKVHGADKKGLMFQSYIEVLIITTIATIFGAFLLSIATPYLNIHLQTSVHIENNILPTLVFMLLAILLLSVIVSFFSTRRIFTSKTINSIKNTTTTGSSKNIQGGLLISFQFTAVILLLITVFVISKQNSFLLNQELGFNRENILTLRSDKEFLNNELSSFKIDLQNLADIRSVSLSSQPIGTGITQNGYSIRDKKQNSLINALYTDEDFLKCFGIKLLMGQNFSGNSNRDRNVILINQKLAKCSNSSNPLDLKIHRNGILNVIGVVEDFNFASLENALRPMLIMANPGWDDWGYSVVNIRFQTSNILHLKSQIDKLWKARFPETPYEISFLDDMLASNYKSLQEQEYIIIFFSLLASIIAIIGLFGLTIFTTKQRTKEIGIRKVNGAKTIEIIAILNGDFVKWVGIAFIIACPISYYTMTKWLENFAYRTELNWWIFALAGFIALGIALLTVSWQSWRAATRNPVESLRYE